ncbi:hypothetical protein DJ530_11870 [Sulfolobus sp. E1]|uniref:hypothetical protein n=1 Tax=Saccharolobus sp. A20 TaxID=1891280 RepID=UPI000845EED3|nr:hypothetical protein [Sulfolobus sp. A20]TRM75631.1 hypothetical protein DJ532_09665 [Sulfolobus sp. A20-N-F8]TRM79157.1 hypothetical protein DJ528_02500 [Sulfolobus sp. B5]TRM80255.1 hypothetical protein DJ524_08225 [Sulfolobus sp. D5]TRM85879.1 hypothetical protein DJ521_06875 [Sulfolobus sp. E3]TRM89248.1 hypothetical protein DJ529_02695 [Sulfolobus sp. C3]TRM97757.1 hypothetical protein DJ530_11870 [Sulfolobus sp. E1]TRN01391.1 hypothetical protein DJ527_05625 [Sulfolobus sp. F1]
MYKVIFKIRGGEGTSLRELRQAGFIPLYFRRNGIEEYYVALFKGKDIGELKEALFDLSYYLSKNRKYGMCDFATIYEVTNSSNLGKVIGGVTGSVLGYYLGGLGGLILGMLGGIFLGELADIQLGEKFVGVVGWPTLIRT